MASVLIVDDEMLIRWALTETLSAAGFGVLEAGTAAVALEHVRSHADDIAVALLDLRLLDADDFALLRGIRNLAPYCKVIVMTAEGSTSVLAAAVEAGAFCAVAKPFDMHVMTGLVRQATASQLSDHRPGCEIVVGGTRAGNTAE
jgi:DNA-binding NtrC family response regulator